MHLSGITLYAFSMLVHHTVRNYCIGIIEVWAYHQNQLHNATLAVLVRHNQDQNFLQYNTKCFQ